MKIRSMLWGLLAAGATASPALAQTPYYEGKTITVLVAQAAGGGTDLFMRAMAPFMRKYIPGSPNIIVQNLSGGGTVRAMNMLAEGTKADGLTVAYGPWEPISQALKMPEFRADYTKFGVFGAISDQRISVIRSDVPPGIKVPEDLGKVTEPFVQAGSTPTGLITLLGSMSLDLLEVPHKVVTGYKGGGDTYGALLQNQAQFNTISYSTLVTRYRDFTDTGIGIAAYAYCYKDENGKFARFDNAPNIPCLSEVYQKIHGKEPSGTLWELLNWFLDLNGRVTFVGLTPAGVPQEALDALAAGFDGASKDPELQELFLKQTGEPTRYVSIDQAKRTVQLLSDIPPDYIALLKKYVEAGQQ